jgi:hypothetical protein
MLSLPYQTIQFASLIFQTELRKIIISLYISVQVDDTCMNPT